MEPRWGVLHQKIIFLFRFKKWRNISKIRRFYANRAYKAAKDNRHLFYEQSSIIEVQTHNTDLKKRLGAYAQQYPGLCRQTDDDGHGGLTFEIEKGRLSFRLTAPYSEERRSKASAWAKKRGRQAGK